MKNIFIRSKNLSYVDFAYVASYIAKASLAVAFILLSQACSNPARLVYEESSFGMPLEVPPDLTKPSTQDDLSFLDSEPDKGMAASLVKNSSACPCEDTQLNLPVLPVQEHIKIARDGAQRWLVLQGEPRNIWPWIRDFWLKNDFKLSLEDPVIGLIETDWKQQRNNLPLEGQAESKKKVAEQDVIDSKIYAVPTREKYRVRLDRGEQAGTTEVFLTHRGVELLTDGKLIVWKLRPTDVELEAEMLARMFAYLGNERKKLNASLASTNQHLNIATLIKDESGHPTLKIDIEFAHVWRRIGLILDRMDFIIEDRDRSVGTYHLRFKDVLKDEELKEEEKGWFSSWFSSDTKESPNLQVVLRDEGSSTHITVRNPDGKFSSEEKATSLLNKIINHLQ